MGLPYQIKQIKVRPLRGGLSSKRCQDPKIHDPDQNMSFLSRSMIGSRLNQVIQYETGFQDQSQGSCNPRSDLIQLSYVIQAGNKFRRPISHE